MRDSLKRLLTEYFPPFPNLPKETGFGKDGAWDEEEFKKLGFRERVRVMAVAWAIQGNGLPAMVVLMYMLKMVLYVVGFYFACLRGREFETERRTFLRLLCYSALWEVSGLGCGAGPSTGKFLPPFTSFWHFIYMGTAKVPSLPSLGLSQTRRNVLDILLFSGFLNFSAVVAFGIDKNIDNQLLALISCWGMLAVSDQVFLLAARTEVYGSMLVVTFLSPDSDEEWRNGIRAVQLCIWIWAGISKLGEWWAYVLPVMTSCNPFLTLLPSVKTLFYQGWPKNVEPSRLAKVIAVFGASFMEIGFPVLLSVGGPLFGQIGLVVSIAFHLFIIVQMPMGMPLEWNVFTIIVSSTFFTDGWVTFRDSYPTTIPSSFPGFSFLSLSPRLAAYLLTVHVVIPCVGNLRPSRISFLLAHRYYAGNWPTTIWLVRRNALEKLNKVISLADFPHKQLEFLYESSALGQFEYRVLVGRMMHMTSKALLSILPKAVNGGKSDMEDAKLLDQYMIIEGELFSGCVLGWCFGDGHLAGTHLLNEVQSRCEFEPEELIHISIGSLPLNKDELPWVIRDEKGAIKSQGICTRRQLSEDYNLCQN